jgi:hypothetical protein
MSTAVCGSEMEIEIHYHASTVYTYVVHKSRWSILDLHVAAPSRMVMEEGFGFASF